MPSRDTSTGWVLEQMVLPALQRGEYQFRTQVKVGLRPGGRTHKVDAVVTKEDRTWLLSVKWQQVGGTAEQKVPFEVICLADAIERGSYESAYLVLGGPGWTLRDFYTGGGLRPHLTQIDRVRIVTLETFVALANQAAL